MKVYLSWTQILFNKNPWLEIEYWLVSYADIWNWKFVNQGWNFKDLFLDSWGFAIRTRGLKLSLENYAKFINTYHKHFTVLANQDTLDTKETLAHQEYLEKETWKYILPVYHANEFLNKDYKLLEYYCEKYPYIALWGIAWWGFKKNIIEKYYNFCFKIGMKYKTKFHWFGVTINQYLKTYPFYSVDSTSWLMWGKFNKILKYQNGKILTIEASHYKKNWLSPWEAGQAPKRLWLGYVARTQYQKYLDSYWKIKWGEYRNERWKQP